MSPPPFVGREAALSTLATALDSAADGRGATINVIGASGMGIDDARPTEDQPEVLRESVAAEDATDSDDFDDAE